MPLNNKEKSNLYFIIGLAVCLGLVWYLREVLLPFAFGFLIAYLCEPIITFLRKRIPSRGLAISVFLLGMIVFSGLAISGSIYVMNKEAKRLKEAFVTLADNNKEDLDKAAQFIWSYAEELYSEEDLKKAANSDSIKEALNGAVPFFKSAIDGVAGSFNSLMLLFTALFYFLFILFDYESLTKDWKNAMSGNQTGKVMQVLHDLEDAFTIYFKQRTKILLILTMLYMLGFWVIGVPGGIILGLVVGLLAYIPYMQFIGLIPLTLGCFVLSIESGNNILIYLGAVGAVFAAASVLEELLLTPKIMGDSTGMSSAMMLLSLSVWGYLLGITGLIIGLPLTTVIMSYVKTYLLPQPVDNAG